MDHTNTFKDWIGRKANTQTDVVTRRLADSFAATLGDALWRDQQTLAGIHWCLAPSMAAPEELGQDGHPKLGGFLPPVPLPKRMWAGGMVEFLDPIRIEDIVSRNSKIKAIDWKTGRSGQMCFVTLSHEYATHRGCAIREDQIIVYRDDAAGGISPTSTKARTEVFDGWTDVRIDTTRLFRYSALTFNAHRIHYDLPYTQNVEAYPDLVIHGPLQATLLLNFAIEARGHLPSSFRYRAMSPATGVQTLRLGYTKCPDNQFSLSVLAENGVKTMDGTAKW